MTKFHQITGPCLVFLILLAGRVSADTPIEWQWQNPTPQGNRFEGVSYADSSNAVAVGRNGTVWRSADAGVTWTLVHPLPTYGLFNKVQMVNTTIGYVAANGGIMMRTQDGGATWELTGSTGTTQNRNHLYFTDPNIGYIVGKYSGGNDNLQKTTDGGATWTNITNPTTNHLHGITFADSDTGVAVGIGPTIIRTIDGGATWTDVSPSYPFWTLNDAAFVDADTGVAVGSIGNILRTTDGGVTWDSLTTIPVGSNLESVSLAGNGPSGFLIATSNVGDILRSQDAGLTWSTVTSGVESQAIRIFDSDFSDVNNGMAVGEAGLVLRTTDGGATWSIQTTYQTLADLNITDVYFGNTGNTGFVLGWADSSVIYNTSDGGTNWTWKYDTPVALNDIHMSGTLTAWACGAGGEVVKTTDGGGTWNSYTAGSEYMWSIHFYDSNIGVTVGQNGALQRSSDGGVTWTAKNSGTSSELSAVTSGDSLHWYAAGTGGTIIASSDAGNTWTVQTSGTSEDLTAIDFYNEHLGWAVGNNGVILHTYNGGQTWVQQTDPYSLVLSWVQFLTPSIGYSVSNNFVMRTIDGGQTWTKAKSYKYGGQNEMYFHDPSTGWGVGTYGAIRKTGTGGTDSLDISLPANIFAGSGDTLKVPLSSGNWWNVPGPFYSFEATLVFADSLLHFAGYDTVGGSAAGFSIDTSFVPGITYDTLFISGASLQNLAFEGKMLDLTFHVDTASVNGETSNIWIEDFTMNEGFPAVRTYDAAFENAREYIYGDADYNNLIQAADASLVLQTAVQKYTPADSHQVHRMDVSANGQVRAFDGALILQHVAAIITAFPAGTTFIDKPAVVGDPVPQLLTAVDEAGLLTLTLELTQVQALQAVEVLLEYDAQRYAYIGYALPEHLPEFLVAVEPSDGIIRLAMATGDRVESDGALVHFRFTIQSEDAEQGDMRVTSLIVNEHQVLKAGETLGAGSLPVTYALGQNYPNPFNPTTSIRYQVPEETRVRIAIYNLLGQRILTLVDEQLPAGFYSAVWNGRNRLGISVASGVYLYRMEAGAFIRTKKMLYLK